MKTHSWKRFLALVLALTMVFSMLPMSVFAAEEGDMAKLEGTYDANYFSVYPSYFVAEDGLFSCEDWAIVVGLSTVGFSVCPTEPSYVPVVTLEMGESSITLEPSSTNTETGERSYSFDVTDDYIWLEISLYEAAHIGSDPYSSLTAAIAAVWDNGDIVLQADCGSEAAVTVNKQITFSIEPDGHSFNAPVAGSDVNLKVEEEFGRYVYTFTTKPTAALIDTTHYYTLAAAVDAVKDGETAVAQIGSTNYETLSAAIAAVKNGGTITLLADCNTEAAATVSEAKAFTISGSYSFTKPAAGTGYKLTEGENGLFTFEEQVTVAKIGETEYSTLALAMEAAKDGDEIVLQADCDEAVTLKAGVKLTYGDYTHPNVTAPEGRFLADDATGKSLMLAVAKVGSTYYDDFASALDAWTAGTTLTLLADVEMTKTKEIPSINTGYILNLSTFTITSTVDVIKIVPTSPYQQSTTYNVTINADATNPGGITAKGKKVITYTRDYSYTGIDRTGFIINGGIFNCATVASFITQGGTKCGACYINGGTFNCTSNCFSMNRLNTIITGGTFNNNNSFSADSTARLYVQGGKFKYFPIQTWSADLPAKMIVGSSIPTAVTAADINANPDAYPEFSGTYNYWNNTTSTWMYPLDKDGNYMWKSKAAFDSYVYVGSDGYYYVEKTTKMADKLSTFGASVEKADLSIGNNKVWRNITDCKVPLYFVTSNDSFNATNTKLTLYTAASANKSISSPFTIIDAEGGSYTGTITLAKATAKLTIVGQTATVANGVSGYYIVVNKTAESPLTYEYSLAQTAPTGAVAFIDGIYYMNMDVAKAAYPGGFTTGTFYVEPAAADLARGKGVQKTEGKDEWTITDLPVAATMSGVDYYSIAEAVDAFNAATEAGDYVITVKEGTWAVADIVIKQSTTKGLTIKPEEGKQVTLAYDSVNGQYNHIFNFYGGSAYNKDNVTIDGFTFDLTGGKIAVWFLGQADNSGRDPMAEAMGFSTMSRYSNNVTVKNCTFKGDKDSKGGSSPSGSQPAGVSFINCVLDGAGYVYGGYGNNLSVAANEDGVNYGWYFENCKNADGTTSKCFVNVQNDGNVLIKNSNITFDSDYAVRTNGGRITVKNSTFNATGTAVEAGDTAAILILKGANNTITVENSTLSNITDGCDIYANGKIATVKANGTIDGVVYANDTITVAVGKTYNFEEVFATIGETKYATLDGAKTDATATTGDDFTGFTAGTFKADVSAYTKDGYASVYNNNTGMYEVGERQAVTIIIPKADVKEQGGGTKEETNVSTEVDVTKNEADEKIVIPADQTESGKPETTLTGTGIVNAISEQGMSETIQKALEIAEEKGTKVDLSNTEDHTVNTEYQVKVTDVSVEKVTNDKQQEVIAVLSFEAHPEATVTVDDEPVASNIEVPNESLNGAYVKVELDVTGAVITSNSKVYHLIEGGSETYTYGTAAEGNKEFSYANDTITLYVNEFSDFAVIVNAEDTTGLVSATDGENGTKLYACLSAALTDINGNWVPNVTITLLENVGNAGDTTVYGLGMSGTKLNMNGHTVYGNVKSVAGGVGISNGTISGKLEVSDHPVFENLTVTGTMTIDTKNNAKPTIKTGSYPIDVTAYTADGYICEKKSDTEWTVRQANYVAEVDGVKYESITEALSKVTGTKPLTLLQGTAWDYTKPYYYNNSFNAALPTEGNYTVIIRPNETISDLAIPGSMTLIGNGNTVSGTMSITTGTVNVGGFVFNNTAANAYAITVLPADRADSATVDLQENSFTAGKIQVGSSATNGTANVHVDNNTGAVNVDATNPDEATETTEVKSGKEASFSTAFAVATVGAVRYATVEAAYADAVKYSQPVKLIADTSMGDLTVAANIELQLNGNTLTLPSDKTLTVAADKALTITGTTGGVAIDGTVNVNGTLDISALGYGTTGLIGGKAGTMSVGANGTVKLPGVWSSYTDLGYIVTNNPKFLVGTVGAKAVLGSNTFKCVIAGNGTSEQPGIWVKDGSKARIGYVGYETLEAAVAAAQSGETVHLLDNIELNSSLTVDKALTIDSNAGTQYSITAGESFTGTKVIEGTATAALTLKNVKVDGAAKVRGIVITDGTLTIEGATVTNCKSTASYIGGVYMTGKSTFVMNSGSITGNSSYYSNSAANAYLGYADDLWIGSQAVGTVNGGEVGKAFVNSNEYSQPACGLKLTAGTIGTVYVEWDGNNKASFNKAGGTVTTVYVANDNNDPHLSAPTATANPANGTYSAVDAVATVNGVAYGTINAAFAALKDIEGDAEIVILKDVSETTNDLYDFNGNVTITASKAVSVTIAGEWGFETTVATTPTFTIAENVTLNCSNVIYMGYNVKRFNVVLNGNITAYIYYGYYTNTTVTTNGKLLCWGEQLLSRGSNSVITVNGSANAGEANNAAIQATAGYLQSRDAGKYVFNNTHIQIVSGSLIMEANGSMEFNNTYIEDPGHADSRKTNVTIETNAEFKLSGKSTYAATAPDAATLTNNGKLTIEAGSAVTGVTSFTNAGTITVDVTGATADSYKLIDYTGSATPTYGTYTLTGTSDSAPYTLKVVDNDLVAVKCVAKIGSTYYQTMQEAFDAAASTATTVVMVADVDFGDIHTTCSNYDGIITGAVVKGGKNVVLDLNGHTVKGTKTVHGDNIAVISNYGDLTIEDNSTGAKGQIWLYDDITGFDYYTMSVAVRNNYNLTVNSGTIKATRARSGLNFAIDTSTNKITGHDVYLTVNGGNIICDYAGIRINSGSVDGVRRADTENNYITINGGNIRGDDCGAIFIHEASGSLSRAIDLEINGGEFHSSGWYALYLYNKDANLFNIKINGGKFEGYYGSMYASVAFDKELIELFAGYFNDSAYYVGSEEAYHALGNLCVEGKGIVKNTEEATKTTYPYVVGTAADYKVSVSTLDGTTVKEKWIYVNTLEEAVEYASAGDTIKLLDNIVITDQVVVNKAVTIDMNGKTISNTSDIWNKAKASFAMICVDGAAVTVTGNGTIDAKQDDAYALNVINEGALTVKNGTFKGNITAVQVDKGSASIEGGTFELKQKSAQGDSRYLLNCIDANYAAKTASIVVTGGTFMGFNPADNLAEGESTDFVATGFMATPIVGGYEVKAVEDIVAKIGNMGYTTLADAVTAVKDNGTTATTITMVNDTETQMVTIPATKNILLDLNGKAIKGTDIVNKVGQLKSGDESVYRPVILNKGVLVVDDTTTGKDGKIYNIANTWTDASNEVYKSDWIVIANDGTMTIKAGWIGNQTYGKSGSAIVNFGTATIDDGHFTIGQGEDKSNWQTAGYTINNKGTMTVNGGELYGFQRGGFGTSTNGATTTVKNVTVNGYFYYYIFYNAGNVTVTVEDGKFNFDTSGNNSYNTPIYTDSASTFTVTGGTFTHKTTNGTKYPFQGNNNTQTKQYKGGVFDWDPTVNVHEDYYVKKTGDKEWTVLPAVAKINGVGYATFLEAMVAANASTAETIKVTLLQDVTTDNIGDWNSGNNGCTITKPMTIDGNGKTLKIMRRVYDGMNYCAVFKANANTTFQNLTIDLSEATYSTWLRAISSDDVELTIKNCKFYGQTSGNTRAILSHQKDPLTKAKLTVENCYFENWAKAIVINDNGSDALEAAIKNNEFKNSGDSKIYVAQKAEIIGNKFDNSWIRVLSCTGNPDTLQVTLNGNTLCAEDNGHYNDLQLGTLSADDLTTEPHGHLDGFSWNARIGNVYYKNVNAAIAAAASNEKADVIEIYDSKNITVTATLESNDKIVVPENRTLTIKNNATFTGAIDLGGKNNLVVETGSTLMTKPSNESNWKVNSGSYGFDPASYCDTGYAAYPNGNKYDVKSTDGAVANIGAYYYDTLEAAFAAAKDGDTIKLLMDATGNGIVVAEGKFKTKGLTVDFNGKTYTVDGTTVGSTGTETQAFQLLKDNKLTFSGGTITSNKAKMLIQNYSELTLSDMTLNGSSLADNTTTAYTLSTNNGKTVVKNTTITARATNGVAFDVCSFDPYTANSVEVKDNSVINGAIELSTYNSVAPELKLTAGDFTNATLVAGENADKVKVSKDSAVTIAAPATFAWDQDGNLVKAAASITVNSTTTYYSTVAEAVAAATAGQTVKLEKASSGAGLFITSAQNNLILDLNGYTYTVTGPAVGSAGTESQGLHIEAANFTLKSSAATAGTLTSTADSGVKMLVQNYSSLSTENVTLDGTNLPGTGRYVLSNNAGTVTLGSGTTITAKSGDFAFDTCKYGTYAAPTVTVNGATVTGDVEISGGNLTLTSGSINGALKMVSGSENSTVTKADSFEATAPAGYSWTKINNVDTLVKSVAKIGNVEYGTLADAVAAATAGQTITLLDNCSGNGIVINKNLTIDFNNTTYTVNTDTLAGSTGTETQAFQLLSGDITFKNGSIVADNAAVKMLIQNYSNLTLDGMTLDATQGNNSVEYVLSNNNGTITIDDTAITAKTNGVAFDVYYWPDGGYGDVSVNVTGNSTISGAIEYAGAGDYVELAKHLTLTKDASVAITAPTGYFWENSTTLKAIVATIGDASYSSLVNAVNAAAADDEIKLELNATGAGLFVKSTQNNLTLNLNGNTYTVTGPAVGSAGTESQALHIEAASFTLKGDATNKGTLTSDCDKVLMLVQNYSSLTTENVTLDGSKLPGTGRYVLSNNAGTTKLGTGTTITAKDGDFAFDTCKFSTYAAPTVTVDGATVTGKIEASGGTLALTSGTLSGSIKLDSSYTDGQITKASGFTATAPEGYFWEDNGDNTATLKAIVATIGSTNYSTLEKAVKAATNGQTVTLVKDSSGAGLFIEATQNITLDLNGKTYTVTGPAVGSAGTESQALHIEATSFTLKNGTLTSDCDKVLMLVQNYSSLSTENVTLDGTNLPGSGRYVLSNNAGTVTLGSGTTITAKSGDFAFDTCKFSTYAAPTVTVNGATVTGDVEISGGNLTLSSGSITGALKMVSGSENSTVTKADSFVATAPAGYSWTKINNVDTLVKSVAKIGTTEYGTLADAIAAVQDNDTITLIDNITNAPGLAVETGKTFTIDFDSHTYTVNKPGAGSVTTETNAFQFLAGQKITLKNGTINVAEENLVTATVGQNIKRIIQDYAELTLEDMTIDGTNLYGTGDYVMSFNNQPVKIIGSTGVVLKQGATVAFDADGGWDGYAACDVTINTTGVIGGNIELGNGMLDIQNVKANSIIPATPTAEQAARVSVTGGLFKVEPNAAYMSNGYKTENSGNSDYPFGVVVAETKVDADPDAGKIDSNDTYEGVTEQKAQEEKQKVVDEILDNASKTSEANIQEELEGVETIGVNNHEPIDFDNNTDTRIEVKLESVQVDIKADPLVVDEIVTTTNTAVYAVKPIVTVTKTNTETGEQTTETFTISNDWLEEQKNKNPDFVLTFTLPVPATMTGDSVMVTHKPAENSPETECTFWTAKVEKDEATGKRFVTIEATEFSFYVLSTQDAEHSVAKIVTSDSKAYYYATVTEAISDAEATDTIFLLKNVTESIKIPADKTIKLNLNGKTLTADESGTTIKNSGALTITDSSTDKTGKVDGVISVEQTNTGKTTIDGGTYTGIVYYADEASDIEIVNGIFDYEPEEECVALTSQKTELQDGRYQVKNDPSIVAAIGTTKYTKLQTAIQAAKNGGTVKVLRDLTGATATGVVSKGWNVTIDLNGKTLSFTNTTGNILTNNGTLTITDSSADKLGKVVGNISTNGGTTCINAGNFSSTLNKTNDGKYAISGGHFTSAVATEDCAQGYRPKKISDTDFTVENVDYLVVLSTRVKEGTSYKNSSVASLVGGGEYCYGETVTISAPEITGFKFLGWYSMNGTEVGINQDYPAEYSFTITDDVYLFAVYEARTDLTYTVIVNGTNYKINDVEKHGYVNTPNVKGGSYITVEWIKSDSEQFLYWTNANGAVLSTKASYTMAVTSNLQIYAVTSSNTAKGVTVVYTNGRGQILSADFISLKDDATTIELGKEPDTPLRLGYNFIGWVITENGKALTDGGKTVEASSVNVFNYLRPKGEGAKPKSSVVIEPEWEPVQEAITVTLEKKDKETNAVTSSTMSVLAGNQTKITADETIGEAPNVKKFVYWELNGKLISYNLTYSLKTTEECKLTAVYSNAEVTVKPTVGIVQITAATETTGKYTFTTVMSWNVPDTYTVNEVGLIWGSTGVKADLYIPNENQLVHVINSGTTKPEGTFTNHLTGNNSTAGRYFRAYVIVTDSKNKQLTYYSDIMGGVSTDVFAGKVLTVTPAVPNDPT